MTRAKKEETLPIIFVAGERDSADGLAASICKIMNKLKTNLNAIPLAAVSLGGLTRRRLAAQLDAWIKAAEEVGYTVLRHDDDGLDPNIDITVQVRA